MIAIVADPAATVAVCRSAFVPYKKSAPEPGTLSTERRHIAVKHGIMGMRIMYWLLGCGMIFLARWVPSFAAEAATWVPDHVVVVIEENLSYKNLTPALTYLTELAQQNAVFTNSHGIDHPSQPNYLALFSGATQGTGSEMLRNPDGSNPVVNGRTRVGSNDPIKDTPLKTPNLAAALLQKGRSFIGYSEDLPSPGFTGAVFIGGPGSGVDYQRKHNPWVNWQAITDAVIGPNQLPSSTNRPFNVFPRDEPGFARLPTSPSWYPIKYNGGHQLSGAPEGTNYGQEMDDW